MQVYVFSVTVNVWSVLVNNLTFVIRETETTRVMEWWVHVSLMMHWQVKFTIGDYMLRQPRVTPAMRAILVDWLVEVQQNFELHHETLYLAVKLTDLYLERETIQKERLQLLGATAVLVASKYEVTGGVIVFMSYGSRLSFFCDAI